jgi:tetratricopeptide (TPR) repeat protein
MRSFFLFVVLMTSSLLQAQQIETMFSQKRYAEIIKRGEDAGKLSGKDLFRVAQSHLHFGNDAEVVRYADLAEKKGYKGWDLYYAKAIALINMEQYEAAIEVLNAGLVVVPDRKVLLLEKAATQYKARKLTDARETYSYIAKLWQGNQVANFMYCQIQAELSPDKVAANCFRERLHFWPDKNQYYREALEQIARIEFFALHNFAIAEQLYSRLANEFSDDGQYLLFLAQLYNFQGHYEKAALQQEIIQRAWYNRKFPNTTYQAGRVQIDGFGDDIIQVEVFWNPVKDPGEKDQFQFFIFSRTASRLLGKISYREVENEGFFSGYQLSEEAVFEVGSSYSDLKDFVISYLSINKERLRP